ncbi:MAG TPA: 6-pyruvoyl-tetrahydropterin synthase-related protein [Candidatus Cybelea sp.]|nr:6-pyruvoyl-tetrahydropterin synthase-related protein [Candidatus Cybelea sp.]
MAIAATAVIAPMLFRGNASGHDFQFHLASWLDTAGQWREGILYPRWAEWANWGFGEPRFVFYPPGSWMIGAALGSVLPWAVVPGTFIWLALVAAGMSMWKLAREWIPAPQAIAAALLFEVNPYHLVIVYYRSDFAELLAGVLLPLVVWGSLGTGRGHWSRVPLLAVAFAGIWLSNAPAAVIATYSLALIFIVQCVLRRSLAPVVPGLTAMAGGFGLAAFYILPAAWERRWVQIAQALADNLRPAQNFLFTHASDPDFVRFNWKVSSVAVGVLVTTGVAAIFAAKRRREFPDLFWVLAALGIVAFSLMLPPSNLLWRALPELRFVQFPWRWLEVLDLVFAFFVAVAIGGSRQKRVSLLAGAIVFLAIGAAATAMILTGWWDSADVPAIANAVHSGPGYEGTDEYAPLGSDRYELPGNPDETERVEGVSSVPADRISEFDTDSGDVVPVTNAKLHVENWSAERREFTAETAAETTLAVKLLNYPAWEIRLDGEEIPADIAPDTGQMLVDLPPGSHRVAIQFRRTWDRTAGGVISALSALTLLVAGWASRSRRIGEQAT